MFNSTNRQVSKKKKQLSTIVLNNINPIITLEEAKEYLQLSSNDYNNRVQSLINSSITEIEHFLGTSILTKGYKIYLDIFSEDTLESSYSYMDCRYDTQQIRIDKPKITSIDNIFYYDTENIEKELTFTDYSLQFEYRDFFSTIYKVTSLTYPETFYKKDAIRIMFKSGFGQTSVDIPADLKFNILEYISKVWNNCHESKSKLLNSLFSNYIDIRVL